MKRVSILPLCLVIFLSDGFTAKTRKSGAASRSNEPFRTFELMDSDLAKLNRQQDELKRAINPDVTKATSTKPKYSARPWSKAAVNARRTATSIRVLADRQQRRYRSLHQPFGVRAFRSLARKSLVVQKSALRLGQTQDDALAPKRYAA